MAEVNQKEIKKEIIKACASDLIYFIKITTPEVMTSETPEFHYEIADMFMDRDIKQIMIQAPRGFGKSSLAKGIIKHHIIFDKGNKVILIQSKTRPEAINRLQDIKKDLQRPIIEDLFNLKINFDEELIWREDKVQFEYFNPFHNELQTIMIRAIGTGQQARGILVRNTRVTLYLLDDPDDEDNCLTNERMDQNMSKFLGNKEGLSPEGRVIVIGTPIKSGCIVDRLNGAYGWVTNVYDAIDDNSGKSIWESYRPYQWVMEKKKEFESIGMGWKWYSEYRCSIQVGETILRGWKYFDGEYIHKNGNNYLKITHRNLEKLPKEEIIPINVYLGIDPASSTQKTADYSTILVAGYDGRNIYVLSYYRNRVPPVTHAETIIKYIKEYHPQRAHIETVGYQEMLRNYLRQRFLEEDIYVPGLEMKFNPRGAKSARLDSLQPYFALGKVWLKPKMNELEDELIFYPRGKHEDLIDAFYYATVSLNTPNHTIEEDEDNPKIYFLENENKFKESWVTA